jgi:hypothetical protein
VKIPLRGLTVKLKTVDLEVRRMSKTGIQGGKGYWCNNNKINSGTGSNSDSERHNNKINK